QGFSASTRIILFSSEKCSIVLGPMGIQTQIETKITKAFAPEFLRVINESDQHSVPPGSESHFRVELVSRQFTGKSRVQRSRQIYDLLSEELRTGVHALSLKLFSPAEWSQRGETAGNPSPACA